jgi:hypothetical protein
MTGFIVANSIAGALTSFPERSGAVSALARAGHEVIFSYARSEQIGLEPILK